MSSKKRTRTCLAVLDGSSGLPKCQWKNACCGGIKKATHLLSVENHDEEKMCMSCLFLNDDDKISKASCLICGKLLGFNVAGYDADGRQLIICVDCQPRVLEQAENTYKKHIENRASTEKRLKVASEMVDELKNQLKLE